MPLPRVLKEMLSLPTAPFVEQSVMKYVYRTCERLDSVQVSTDRWGNLLAFYSPIGPAQAAPKRPPLVFSAHMDHPGFIALEPSRGKTLRAAFRGWVEPEYFTRAGVRFFDGRRWIRGRISKITKVAKVYRMIGRSARPEEVEVRMQGEIPAGAPGMWDLPDPTLKGDRVHARGCDDIAGCAAMLALLERLAKKRAAAEVYCLFTRAEEVGFIGAIGAAKNGTAPPHLPIIAIETSKALPNAPIGDGPVLRVGDKSSVFSPGLTQFCNRVALDLLHKRKKTFKYQRKLMDGGTCESTAFCSYGYTATGVCVALGNYHNMDTDKKRIASEVISLSDWKAMVDWFEALVLDEQGFQAEDGSVQKGLEERFAMWEPLLGEPLWPAQTSK